ncbi:MarR family transcriptional regulator [Microbacterium sp. STN6]|uniref:MarR family winged helix-turn-helix transcriptional regulator n=1 Tax=Microbacterium sp. STN6 TaxID=2995588 RepID=UPI002260C5D4|nr:MarR family transcriptional regulator [Microbacterium sp. STN6]MCX7523006.1 MarR family transcriptional regulator [Microbacterium sp. STN6]
MESESEKADPVRVEVASRLAVAVGRLNRRIRPRGDGLSHGMLSALSSIVRLGPLRPGDLARLEVIAAPTATRVIADLEGRGLIARSPDPDDGRSFFIRATDAGIDAVVRARSERAEGISRLLGHLDDAAVGTIAEALDALEAAATAP